MYLSNLLIDTGSNPDRPRPGRLWLRNLYHVHQRLCMAFPSNPRKQRDPHFLAPYAPDDFPELRHVADRKKTEIDPQILTDVHTPRTADAGFLFRVDLLQGGRNMIVVQSALEPDWDYAFHNAGYLLAAPPELKVYDPRFSEGDRLSFRLLANPTRRLSRHSLREDGQPIEAKDIGKRVPVRDDRLSDWLTRQGESSGFVVDKDDIVVRPGYVYVNKKGNGQGERLRSVRYDGIFTVTNPHKLQTTLVQGVGSAKGFGFGLLSIAPLR
ncbi:MAG: type I-E CRISPR-associated protein Cas6/Cse3/CasE [Armatimonadota bacterium]|nr:type I-E CRISPR-associated protein Cas6/Cse3/CasE [Armatimonadota bacterium]